MPILNYTTKIEVRRTTGEISELLADLGANSVQVEYDAKRLPVAVSFQAQEWDAWSLFGSRPGGRECTSCSKMTGRCQMP